MPSFLSILCHLLIFLSASPLQASIKLVDDRSSFFLDLLSCPLIRNTCPALRDGQVELVLLQISTRPFWIGTSPCLKTLAAFPWITVSWFPRLSIRITLNLIAGRLEQKCTIRSFVRISTNLCPFQIRDFKSGAATRIKGSGAP